MSRPRIGVLALQGGFLEHVDMIRNIGGVDVCEVRTLEQLQQCDGLILPGGESTAIARLARVNDLIEPLRDFVDSKKPMFGTCAGLILLSDRVESQTKQGQEFIGGMNITSNRNHYGRQLASFEASINAPILTSYSKDASNKDDEKKDKSPMSTSAVFIRAPGIIEHGENVEVLASIEFEGTTHAVAVRQDNLLGISFHPELTTDARWHKYFLDMVFNQTSSSNSGYMLETEQEYVTVKE